MPSTSKFFVPCRARYFLSVYSLSTPRGLHTARVLILARSDLFVLLLANHAFGVSVRSLPRIAAPGGHLLGHLLNFLISRHISEYIKVYLLHHSFLHQTVF